MTCATVPTIRFIPEAWACLDVASLLWWPQVSWAHGAKSNSRLCCQSRTIWIDTLTLAAQSACWLFWCSSVAQLLCIWSIHVVYLWLAYLIKQQYLAAMGQPRWVCLCPASCFPSIVLSTCPVHLLPSMSQRTDKVLAISLAQQYLEASKWLLPLQIHSIHLHPQLLLHLVVWNSMQYKDMFITYAVFLQCARSMNKQGTLLLIFW